MNIDDHLKNFSFIYNDLKDRWNLAPAYDLTYPLDALINYTRTSRALSINGKRTGISRADLLKIADLFTVKNPNGVIDEVLALAPDFRALATMQNLPEKVISKIETEFLLF
jgi:serine/threonine-protein kinase HipA